MFLGFFWLLFVMIGAAAGGMTVLVQSTEFPFYNQGHRSQQRQDGVNEVHERATFVVDSSITLRSTIDEDSIVRVLYVGDDVDNVLTESRIRKIHQFEQEMMAQSEWPNDMCRLLNGVCQRPISPVYFFADDTKNPYEYFPTMYDPYPSYNNTVQFQNSYYSKPVDVSFDLDLSQANIDRVAQFWALYGTSNISYFQYFNTENCMRQQTACRAVMNFTQLVVEIDPVNPIVIQNNSCRDRNDLFAATYNPAQTNPPDFPNCTAATDWLESIGIGCDDKLTAFNLSDVTVRHWCCQTCFEKWYPPTSTYEDNWGNAVTLDYLDCAADQTSEQLLAFCVDQNKGVFQTQTFGILTGTYTTQQVSAAVANVLDNNGVHYELPIVVTNGGSGATSNWVVKYPWSNQQNMAYDIFASIDFSAQFRAQLPAGVQFTFERTQRQTTRGLITSDALEETSNPFWMVVDGNFGNSANLDVASKASAVRSNFYNGLPIKGYSGVVSGKEDQLLDLGNYCYDAWQDQFDDWGKDYGDNIRFFWNCAYMEYPYSDSVLNRDQSMITLTVLFILFYMAFNTNSWFIACNGMAMIFLNFIPAIWLYRFIFQQTFFGILQVMSMFLILSIGADDVFVVIDTWGQNNCVYSDKPAAVRLTATLKSAGKVMLTTSASTIFSFVANCFSVIPAISTFGIFCAVLVFVNYCAVCLFFPTVLFVHELYFDGTGWQEFFNNGREFKFMGIFNCGCRLSPETLDERNKRYEESGLEDRIPDPNVLRPIDEWFAGSYYHFIHRARICVMLACLVWFCFLLSLVGTLTPDPEPPNIYPNGYNYGVFWDEFTDNFGRDASQQNLKAWLAFGLEEPGIDRSENWVPTDPKKLGVPKYDNNFNPFSKEAMEWFVAICDDLATGDRYGIGDLQVGSTPPGGVPALKCPMTAFREWIWTGSTADYNLDTSINPRTKNFVEAPLISCMNATGNGVHPPKTWPINGFWNNWYRWLDWLETQMPTGDPEYVAGTTNFQHWSSQLWYDNDTWTNAPMCSGYPAISFTPKLFQINIRLSVKFDYDHTDGIQLYEYWEDYLQKWKDGQTGKTSQYTPVTSHCQDLDIETCESTNGCEYISGGTTSYCNPRAVDYPGAIPAPISSSFVTDEAAFAYYFLQEQLIAECFQGIALALFLAFIILNMATANYVIATLATIIITMIVLMIIGFTVLLGWKLGLMESLIYVMVVGMSVDYVVHLGEAYIEGGEEHPERNDRVAEMLEVRGMSVLSGAISTLGGISFLFGAFIVFFVKFAVVIFFLIFTSLVYSLVFFAALMDTVGPNGEFGEWMLVYNDIKSVWQGEMSWYDCCMNCCVPHDSKHQPRVKSTFNLDVGKEDEHPMM